MENGENGEKNHGKEREKDVSAEWAQVTREKWKGRGAGGFGSRAQ
jgi:hypothetical protein